MAGSTPLSPLTAKDARHASERRSPVARRLWHWVFGGLSLIAALCWVRGFVASERVSAQRLPELTRAQLGFLANGLERRADDMQRLFPEGRVFTLALYGGAWVNEGRHAEAPIRERALGECRRTLSLLESARSRAPFGPVAGLPHGMFYEAWTNWLRGGCLSLEATPGAAASASDAFTAACARLENAITLHGPFVESYPGAAWPADSVVGVASLAACAQWLGERPQRAVQKWLDAVRRELDPTTLLVPHSAHGPGARGSSSALICAFLPSIDRAFAEQQYARFRQHFATRRLGGLLAFREYPNGQDGPSDVDSGPLLLGVSGPATIVGMAAAHENGDAATWLELRRASEAVGLPLEWSGRRTYGFGRLAVGEAFLAWASRAESWTSAAKEDASLDAEAGGRAALRLLFVAGLGVIVGLGALAWHSPTVAGPARGRRTVR